MKPVVCLLQFVQITYVKRSILNAFCFLVLAQRLSFLCYSLCMKQPDDFGAAFNTIQTACQRFRTEVPKVKELIDRETIGPESTGGLPMGREGTIEPNPGQQGQGWEKLSY